MRVLLTVPSSEARLHQLVTLGWALRTAGHEVQIAGRPAFAGTIARTGFIAVAVGAGEDRGEAWLTEPEAVDELAAFVASWAPELVIWDERAAAGAVVAQLAGAASIRMRGVFGPVPDTAGRLSASLDRYGLPLDAVLADDHLTLVSVPPSLAGAGGPGGLPLRYLPYAGSEVVPGWLRRTPRRPRVWLTSAGAWVPPAALFEAVAQHDIEVVCSVPAVQFDASVQLPDNVRLAESAPLRAVLPGCSAVIHDGAPPVAAAALAYGLPQLAVASPSATAGGTAPPPLARQIADYGAGLLMSAGDSAGSLAGQLGALIADETLRQHAGQLQKEISAMPSPRDLVPELAGLTVNRNGECGARAPA